VIHFCNRVKPIWSVASWLSVKYEDILLSLCIMLRKKFSAYGTSDGNMMGAHNRRWSSHAAASNEPLHDHGWRSVNGTSTVVSKKNCPPPLWEWSWLVPWRPKTPWRFDPLFYLSAMKILYVCQKSRNELVWKWLELKPLRIFIRWWWTQFEFFMIFFKSFGLKQSKRLVFSI
jgi:hypothetical protein